MKRVVVVFPYSTLPCLNNNPYTVIEDDLQLPLGLSYTLDEQCRLEFGDKASFCRAVCTLILKFDCFSLDRALFVTFDN